jgi:hypothetical protein
MSTTTDITTAAIAAPTPQWRSLFAMLALAVPPETRAETRALGAVDLSGGSLAQEEWPMGANFRSPHRRSQSLARSPATEKEMWRAYLIATGMALGLIAAWAVLVSFTA